MAGRVAAGPGSRPDPRPRRPAVASLASWRHLPHRSSKRPRAAGTSSWTSTCAAASCAATCEARSARPSRTAASRPVRDCPRPAGSPRTCGSRAGSSPTRTTSSPPRATSRRSRARRRSSRGSAPRRRSPDEPARPTWAIDFIATTPDVELFPRRAWIRATERALRDAPNDALDYGDHRGRIELRRALSEYLGRVRGVRIEPERMAITQGFTQALDLVSRVLRARGATTIAFESPSQPTAGSRRRRPVCGWRASRSTTTACGRTCWTPCPPRRSSSPRPTSSRPAPCMAPERRAELVTWANRANRLIIEDDYDAEFRYDRNGIGAIQGLDPCRVIHIGTASKTLAPGIRLGWMSLPDELVDEIRAAKAAQDSGSPAIEQLALAELDLERRLRPPRRPRPTCLPAASRRPHRGPRKASARAGARTAPPPGSTSCSACPTTSTTSRSRLPPRNAGSGSTRSRRCLDAGRPSVASSSATAASRSSASMPPSRPSRNASPMSAHRHRRPDRARHATASSLVQASSS